MAQTIAEKIISAHCGKEVKAGDFAIVSVDLAMIHDSTGPNTIKAFERFGVSHPWDPLKIVIILDHATPSPNERVAGLHTMLRDFSRKHGIKLYDSGEGICHQVVVEKGHVRPGQFAVGTDSHTCTYGAVNAFAFGIGSTDMSGVFLTGKLWVKVPETIKILYTGALSPGVTSKDLMLSTIARIGAAGADYKALEFSGDTIPVLSVSERLTMANMAIECGAKAGLFPVDEVTRAWFSGKSIYDVDSVYPDKEAHYCEAIYLDASLLEPQIACPHQVDNVKPLSEVAGQPVNTIFIGTCTNGRLEDLAQAARILDGNSIHESVRLLVCPASREVAIQALSEGYLEIFLRAGATILPPGCGPCPGTHLGVPGNGESVLSTANRNFKGRMGNNKAFIYLGSPLVCASSALEGKIADPRKYLGKGRDH